MPRFIDADALVADMTNRYCMDCVKRKGMRNGKHKLVYAIGDAPCRACGVMDAMEDIENAPTIEAEPKWISVNDRLPNEATGKVLIYMPMDTRNKVQTGQYSEFSKTWYIGDMCGVGGDDPIAWMPLPEPPKMDEVTP